MLAGPAGPTGLLARFAGVVVGGNKRGRVLGFPTANIQVDALSGDLEDGVYAGLVSFPPGAETFGATVSVGNNPTFGDVKEKRVEAYIHDFDADLYGRRIGVHVIAFLRPMERFDTVDELIRQTSDDVVCARSFLNDLLET
ncbi:riboflavin kinase [Paeniglutamicibacter kerguelensis]|uniref:riboflavin kinase n=1 Tax=Paeniglutamicibacter kerguelensis TaxID=254788 RepID=A0ABS4XHV9_9MICC|nr:riboflavin kinase [Paeniglutamicibacter kerguelensis]MBP2388062.1 riboflavin kinase/FMN adenylyltransferase [Paeniglutamicibacter kerguelensis]